MDEEEKGEEDDEELPKKAPKKKEKKKAKFKAKGPARWDEVNIDNDRRVSICVSDTLVVLRR